MLLVWLLIRWQRVRDDRLLLVLGLVIGIAVMTKFQVMLLCLVLLVTIAVCGPRDLLRRLLLWAGAALAVLIAAPTLMFAGLAGLVLGAYGLVRLLLADELRAYRYLGVTFVALYVVFVATAPICGR
jgi:hypothetical protein